MIWYYREQYRNPKAHMLESILFTIIHKMGNTAVILMLAGLTATTSGVAGYQLYKNVSSSALPPQAAQVRVLETSPTTSEPATVTATANQGSTPSNTLAQLLASPTPKPAAATPSPTAQPAATSVPKAAKPATTPTPTPGTSANVQTCIITVFGKTYDVQRLRTTHGGGDIFVCNSDMTTAYQSAHGSNTSRLAAYAVTTSGGQTGQTGQTSGGSTSVSGSHEDDDKDELEEERERTIRVNETGTRDNEREEHDED